MSARRKCVKIPKRHWAVLELYITAQAQRRNDSSLADDHDYPQWCALPKYMQEILVKAR